MQIVASVIAIAFILLYAALIPRLLFKRDLVSLQYITIETVLQNIICIMTSAFLNNTISQLVLLYKELIFYGVVVLYFLTNKRLKIRKSSVPLIIMVLLCVPYFFVGVASLYTKLICFRQIMTPIILILYGRTLSINERELRDYFSFLVKIGVGIVIFGIIEEFVIGDSLWFSLHIEKYMDMKGFSKWVYSNGLPGNYYSADLYMVVGMLRRMVSIMADPLLTGHFLALCIVIILYNRFIINPLYYAVTLVVLTVGVIFTLSKGAILVIAIAYTYKLWCRYKPIAILCGVIGVILLAYMIKNNTLYTISQHTGGLIASFGNIVGKGFGSAGNYSNLYGNASSEVAESYMGALLGQMGLIGFGIFLYMFIYYSKKLFAFNRTAIGLSIFAYIMGILFESFVSESSINFVGSGIAFIVFGILTKKLGASNGKEKYQGGQIE